MAEIVVNATWRLSGVQFSTPHDGIGVVTGSGEILLSEASDPIPGGMILRKVKGEDGKQAYGVMIGEAVERKIISVRDESVTVNGKTITFAEVNSAIAAFFEKWRIEDAQTPPINPEAAELTPHQVPPNPVGPEGLPPPIIPT